MDEAASRERLFFTVFVPPMGPSMKVVFRSVSYFRKDARLIALLFLLIGASVGLNLLAAWPMAVLVDSVLSQTPKSSAPARVLSWLAGSNTVKQIIVVSVAILVIRVAQEGTGMVRTVLNATIKYRGTRRLRTELFEKLQVLGLPWHRLRSQGDTLYRVINDTSGPWGILDTLIGSGAATITLLAMTVIMALRSLELTLFAFAITPLLALVNRYFGRLIRRRAIHAKEREAGFTVALQRAVTSIGITQAFGREKREQELFRRSVDSTVKGATDLAWAEALYPLAVQVVFAMGAAIIMGYGGWLVYRDQFVLHRMGGVSCGDLIVFMAYLGQLWDPLGWVLGFPTKIQSSLASCERVFQVLDQEPHVRERPNALHVPVLPRSLSLKNVSFSYDATTPVLRNISVSIEPGEMVAFVGASGSGKSTIVSLLSRFYDTSHGSIRLDHWDIKDIRLADLRRHIAIVSQENALLTDTIAANLRYGRPDASDDEIRLAAREAGADVFIESLPERYDTIVSESGGNLSGGQRQRLAIARALVSNAPLLVLDEPTSALDPRNEGWILETLRRLRRKRTIILITHRLESVADCDKIIVLGNGTIVESGTHLQLLSLQGMYADMVYRSKEGTAKESMLPSRVRLKVMP